MDRAAYAERITEVLSGEHGAKVGYPIGLCAVEVKRTVAVGAGLVRITFGGEELAGFHSYVPDEHVRLVFPDDDGVLRLPRKDGLSLEWGQPRPVSREYTVRRFSAADRELDIDFAIHPGGLASDWALAATPGTPMHIAGPPGGVVVPTNYDRFLLAGDITALPAIARWLEWLPREAAGWAVIEVGGPDEEIAIDAPLGVEVRWVHRGDAEPGTGDAFERAVRGVEVPAGERVYVWLAGEAGVLKPLRRWVRTDLGVGPKDSLIAGYWKRGVADYDRDE
ncbi:Vibriobactin utilization protein ViuB [Nocardia otitidiscaviarum]|uniref:Siderophore-interacting protein n=1 Tax=Nocardia otitidiscaviarum TaxID=1823 RepID=A0A379JH97_9NOCA|nr:siderophore-interacting protein [Nocardia otitidiscaviarum]MCP9623512.1 siderophore-interacting protein [Nocardia otitidiscaviarum]QDP78268.1 siderophore-interacting protein [Nocardia otitidiscaviarum]SUD47794.1 Vibriobactin utilization protein ViuB [Nocardia otitidiscaviarum]